MHQIWMDSKHCFFISPHLAKFYIDKAVFHLKYLSSFNIYYFSVAKTDYINASLVEVPEVKRKYILTQGPLGNTVEHFWSMVWEQVKQDLDRIFLQQIGRLFNSCQIWSVLTFDRCQTLSYHLLTFLPAIFGALIRIILCKTLEGTVSQHSAMHWPILKHFITRNYVRT